MTMHLLVFQTFDTLATLPEILETFSKITPNHAIQKTQRFVFCSRRLNHSRNDSGWKAKSGWHWNAVVWAHSFHSVGHRRWFLIYATVGEAFLPDVYLEPFPQDYISDHPTWTLTKLVAGLGVRGWQGGTKYIPLIRPLSHLGLTC